MKKKIKQTRNLMWDGLDLGVHTHTSLLNVPVSAAQKTMPSVGMSSSWAPTPSHRFIFRLKSSRDT